MFALIALKSKQFSGCERIGETDAFPYVKRNRALDTQGSVMQ